MKLNIVLVVAAALGVAAHTPGAAIARRHQGIARSTTESAGTPDDGAQASNTTTLAKRSFSGSATWFNDGLGACGKNNSPGDKIVALNSAQYGGGQFCFKSIVITGRGQTHPATIVDECPGCGYGSLDMSTGLFQEFADLGVGEFSITWNFAGEAPPPPPAPKPKPTTTRRPPPPPPSSTHHSTTHSTSSSVPTHTTTSSSHSHSSHTSHSTTTTTTTSTTSTSSAAPTPTGNLWALEQAFFGLALLADSAVRAAQSGST